MYIYNELLRRADTDNPVRVGLIGAGKFGSMFLAQVPTTPGLDVSVIVDLAPDRARAACRTVGWTDDQIAAVSFTDDAEQMMRNAPPDRASLPASGGGSVYASVQGQCQSCF